MRNITQLYNSQRQKFINYALLAAQKTPCFDIIPPAMHLCGH
ncbi:hypothetical protein GPLA_4767 [Paraglaciecola polaris LMG 21857]|uniref:Uncharacterized protein n=1 Tax=Paraglaciecola polaris LMG 21857 TaxID=1129793 RepID=K6ZI15_9ALTE|nr:hypothetical protein GPLA_4767 [Paraglaciecola polaris LMG 21857]